MTPRLSESGESVARFFARYPGLVLLALAVIANGSALMLLVGN
jgi:hypothetical protein